MEYREWEKRLSKDDLFAELEDCIRIMNSEDFGLTKQERLEKQRNEEARIRKEKEEIEKGIISERKKKRLKRNRIQQGDEMVKSILKMYQMTTLCELSERQIQDVLDYIRMSVTRG